MEELLNRKKRFRRASYSKLETVFPDRSLKNFRQLFFITTMFSRCNTIAFFVVLVALIIFGGVNDKEAINLYLHELQTLSDHRIKQDQIQHIKFFYKSNRNKDPLREERHKVRHEFESKKRRLKSQWESKYSLSWPSIKKSRQPSMLENKKGVFSVKRVFNENLPIIKESAYEAHHIVPINAGGINVWWNITPLSPRNHAILHESIEEKACFSHDIIHRTIMRFLLRLQCMFQEIFGKYINKKGTNYAAQRIPALYGTMPQISAEHIPTAYNA